MVQSSGLALRPWKGLSNFGSLLNKLAKCSPVLIRSPGQLERYPDQRDVMRRLPSPFPRSRLFRNGLNSCSCRELQSRLRQRQSINHPVCLMFHLCRIPKSATLAMGGMLHTMWFSLEYITACKYYTSLSVLDNTLTRVLGMH